MGKKQKQYLLRDKFTKKYFLYLDRFDHDPILKKIKYNIEFTDDIQECLLRSAKTVTKCFQFWKEKYILYDNGYIYNPDDLEPVEAKQIIVLV